MPTVGQVAGVLEELAPLTLAESWDNVGLLVGDLQWPARRVMTCLTITPAVAQEAIDAGAQLIVSHHPLPFHALKSVTAATTSGRVLLQLIGHSIAVYSAHTAFDSASAGINQHLAIGLGLQSIRPLAPSKTGDEEEGAGRYGIAAESLTLSDLAKRMKSFLDAREVRFAGRADQVVQRIAFACGSGGSFFELALEAQCDALVTGEASFHTCLEAEAQEKGLILVGHFASERFALVSLADYLADQLAEVEIWASRCERDPLQIVD